MQWPDPCTVDDIARLRWVDGFALSPDRQHYAAFVRQADPVANDYRTGWFVGDVRGEALTYVGDGGEACLRISPNGRITGPMESHEVHWSPDGQWIAYTLRRDGEVQLWRSKFDGSVQEQLTHNAADVRRFAWSENGHAVYFNVGSAREAWRSEEQQRARRGYQYDEELHFYSEFMLPQLIRQPETELTVWRVDVAQRHEQIGNIADRVAF